MPKSKQNRQALPRWELHHSIARASLGSDESLVGYAEYSEEYLLCDKVYLVPRGVLNT
jgi:hypothetical protein